jgi:hypothetical protein
MCLGQADKGFVRAHLAKRTGLSRAQVSRLVARHRISGKLRDRRGRPARPFPRQLCESAWDIFGDARCERLDEISNGHLDNLRG